MRGLTKVYKIVYPEKTKTSTALERGTKVLQRVFSFTHTKTEQNFWRSLLVPPMQRLEVSRVLQIVQDEEDQIGERIEGF